MAARRNHPVSMDTGGEKDLAWTGDAVLAPYAREWLIGQHLRPLFLKHLQNATKGRKGQKITDRK